MVKLPELIVLLFERLNLGTQNCDLLLRFIVGRAGHHRTV
jgi:hypothetical protein